MSKKIFILGGYGNSGYLIADYLLKETDAEITIAGRDLDKARMAAYQLNDKYQDKRSTAVNLSASSFQWIKNAIEGYDYLVLASSSSTFVENVVRACLETNTNYFDTQLSSPQKIKMLRGYEKKINEKGLAFITDGGFHPGLVSAIIRYGSLQFDEAKKAFVHGFARMDWKSYKLSKGTLSEFMTEIKNYNPTIFKKSNWKKAGLLHSKKVYFDREIGVQRTSPYYLEELSELPNLVPSLNEAGFYVCGLDWFTKNFVAPLGYFSFKVIGDLTTKPLVKLFKWSCKKFSKPPYKIKLKLIAEGEKDGRNKKTEITLEHKDGYVMTAIPVAVSLKQIINGTINPNGLCFQGNVVEISSFFEDLQKLGIKIRYK